MVIPDRTRLAVLHRYGRSRLVQYVKISDRAAVECAWCKDFRWGGTTGRAHWLRRHELGCGAKVADSMTEAEWREAKAADVERMLLEGGVTMYSGTAGDTGVASPIREA